MALTAPAAGAQAIDGPALHLPRDLSSQQSRLAATAAAAQQLLGEWFGAPAGVALTIDGVSWRAGAISEVRSGSIAVPLRWLAPVRDQSNERAVIGALVAQVWSSGESSSPFQQALTAYTASQVIHRLLTGTNFEAPRFFGGHVSFPLRGILLSPPADDPRPRVWKFDADGAAADGGRTLSRNVHALQTIERYVGWPTMLETLSALRAAGTSQLRREIFGEKLSEIRGTDMRFLVSECFNPEATFDYAVASLASEARDANVVESTVTVVRIGAGRFILRNGGDPTLPVTVRFADGSEVHDRVDGAVPSTTLVYSARTRAVSAVADSGAVLLLDVNRDNNAIVRDAPALLGVRLALQWLTWLQNAMLSYTAIA